MTPEIRLERSAAAANDALECSSARPERELATRNHAAHGQSENEQGNETVDQERLPLVSRSKVRPCERQHQHRGNSVEVVRGAGRSRARHEHGHSGADLHHDECLANRQRSSVAAGNRLTAEIGERFPTRRQRP